MRQGRFLPFEALRIVSSPLLSHEKTILGQSYESKSREYPGTHSGLKRTQINEMEQEQSYGGQKDLRNDTDGPT
jgi:hypothetical protein